MKDAALSALKPVFVILAVAFSTQVAVVLASPEYRGLVNSLAPVFGVAVGLAFVFGLRCLPWIFLGALLPSIVAHDSVYLVFSVPLAAVVSSAIAVVLLRWCDVEPDMQRIRDTLLLFLIVGVVAALLGAAVQSLFICLEDVGLVFGRFTDLLLSNWLAAAVGSVMAFPFILAWSHREDFELGPRKLFEVLLWLTVLVTFAWVTFENWAPTDVLLYPMELAIFPIMAWGAIRLGLRVASAGVLVLALVAACELVPVFGAEGRLISQSPSNVWVFVGIVSITSVCLASVMTELRKREAQIAENESRLRAFTDALPDVAFVITREGQFREVYAANGSIEANHQIANASNIRGKKVGDVFDSETSRAFHETITAALHEARVADLEYCMESVDLGTHWFAARVSPMRSQTGELDCVAWVAYNITQRKEFEAATMHRDGILRATAKANNTLLTYSDFNEAVDSALRELGLAIQADRVQVFELGDQTGEGLFSFNCRFEWCRSEDVPRLMAGAKREGPMEEFFPSWLDRMRTDGILTVGDREVAEPMDRRALDRLGSRAASAVPMRLGGNLSGFIVVSYCCDAHEWREAEKNALRVLASSVSGFFLIQNNQEALRVARDRANSASIAKGEFLAMMSHEIRTPMNAIIGYTDLLRQTNLTEVQTEQASIIKRSGRALLELINNILDYSKIEAESLNLESAEFDLEQVICEALESILPQAKEKSIRVDYAINPSLSSTYVGDPQRLRQILVNLAANAEKFTSQGSIKIEVNLRFSECDEAGDALYFKVIDTGCGIEPEKLDRLFQPFSQVDSSTTRAFGGTGLGLVISKRLVERMDGRIWLSSYLGEGSTFHFVVRLPRPEQHAATRPPFALAKDTSDLIDASFAVRHPLKILLCEDDEDNRWVICELLRSLGYQPESVGLADDVISELYRQRYDVVLLDIRLPERDGYELTNYIRGGGVGDSFRDQYIIAVTAFAMKEDRDKCLAAGMNDYLRKPLEINCLKESLENAHASLVEKRASEA